MPQPLPTNQKQTNKQQQQQQQKKQQQKRKMSILCRLKENYKNNQVYAVNIQIYVLILGPTNTTVANESPIPWAPADAVDLPLQQCPLNLALVSIVHLILHAGTHKVRESGGPPVHTPPPPPPPPGTYHYGPKMYLRVFRTQSHLFSGQLLGCTGVIVLCVRVPFCVQPAAD